MLARLFSIFIPFLMTGFVIAPAQAQDMGTDDEVSKLNSFEVFLGGTFDDGDGEASVLVGNFNGEL